MATLNIVVLPKKVLADGSNKIRISVAHNGQTRYIVSDIKLEKGEKLKGERITGGSDPVYKSTRLRKLLREYQDRLDSLEAVNSLNCAEVVSLLKGEGTKITTLDEAFKNMLAVSTSKESSRRQYSSMWESLTKSLDAKTPLEAVSYPLVLKIESELFKRNLSQTSVFNIIGLFKMIVRHAVRFDYVTYRKDPFLNYKSPMSVVRENWITIDQLRSVRDYKSTLKSMRSCQDIFMLSFYLGGMNVIDISKIDWEDVMKSGEVCYKRSKVTGSRRDPKDIKYTVPSEIIPILQRLREDEILKSSSPKTTKNVTRRMSIALAKIGKELNIPNLMFYSARKTFSQIAFQLGINTQVIDYILGHSMKKAGSVMHHYVYVTPEMATEAIRKVCDFIK